MKDYLSWLCCYIFTKLVLSFHLLISLTRNIYIYIFFSTGGQGMGMTGLPSCHETATPSPCWDSIAMHISLLLSTKQPCYVNLRIWALCLFSTDRLLRVGAKFLPRPALNVYCSPLHAVLFSIVREGARRENTSRAYTNCQALVHALFVLNLIKTLVVNSLSPLPRLLWLAERLYSLLQSQCLPK